MAHSSIPYTKGLPYGIFMKQVVFDMYENGYLSRIKRTWKLREKQNCDAMISKQGRPLSTEKLASLFIIVFFGIISAICIMLMEFVSAHFQKKSRIDAPPKNDTNINFMVQVNVRKFQKDPIYKKNVQDSFTASILQETECIN